jgi:hypothetical protein
MPPKFVRKSFAFDPDIGGLTLRSKALAAVFHTLAAEGVQTLPQGPADRGLDSVPLLDIRLGFASAGLASPCAANQMAECRLASPKRTCRRKPVSCGTAPILPVLALAGRLADKPFRPVDVHTQALVFKLPENLSCVETFPSRTGLIPKA